MPIEELCIRTLAHGVQSQQDFLQELLRIEQMGVGIVVLEFFFDQVIEVGEDRIVLRPHAAEVGLLRDTPLGVELGYHDLNGVDMGITEILIGPEEVLEKGYMLRQQSAFAEGFRCCLIVRVTAVIPAFGLQGVDDVLPGHEISKAAAHGLAHFLLLMLGIQRDNGFPGLQQIEDEQFHEIALTLAGVAENENVGRGLILIALIEVHKDVAAVFVLSDIETLCVRFAGIIEGVQIRHTGCREDTLELLTESVVSHGAGTAEALLLTKQEPVHIELAPHQLRQHIGLEHLELAVIRSGQLDIDGAVEQRLSVAVHGSHQRCHILQIAFRCDRLLQVVGVGAAHAVFVCGILNDALFLGGCYLAGVDAQRDPILFTEVAKDGLLIGLGRILPQRPHAAECVATDEVVRFKLDHGRRDHIQKGFDACSLPALRHCFFCFLCQMNSSFTRQQ